MQQRNKWMFDSPGGVQVGDLVLLKEDIVPPLKWIMGRIIEVHLGQDGRNRVVTIKTAQGTVDRGVQKDSKCLKTNISAITLLFVVKVKIGSMCKTGCAMFECKPSKMDSRHKS
ncbi:methyltransferase (DUF5641) [Popillia japonica]|uniref:Methyltransferase (DUF5641) n=1 Tax=Popillia japonica TaxID=7064 RepID=A0AAW1MZX6_POPJA